MIVNIFSKFVVKYYKILLISSGILLVLSLIGVSKLQLSSNMEDMLPENSEALNASNEFEQYFESQDNVIVVVKGNKETSVSFMEQLTKRLKENGIADKILYKIDKQEMDSYTLLYMDMAIYRDIERMINEKQYEKLQNLLIELNAKHKSEEIDYISNENNDVFMMIVKPEIDKVNFIQSRQDFYDGLQNKINQLLANNKYNDIQAGITGGVFIQDLEADTVAFEGFESTFLIILMLILIFIIISFRRLILPLLTAYPLILGALISAALAYILYGSLNMFSISFALLLLGLGIDFAVHLISRYLEERSNNMTVTDALITTLKETGISIIIGAVTTCAAFFTFIFAKFKAFEQMGVLSGIGIMVLCFIMLCLIPPLVIVIDRKKQDATTKNVQYKFLNSLGSFTEKYYYVVLGIIIIILPLLWSNVTNTKVVGDINKLYPDNLESKKWEKVVIEEFDYCTNTLMFMMDNEEELLKAISLLEKRDDISNIESVFSYLPQEQDYKIKVLNQLKSTLVQLEYPNSHLFSAKKMALEDLPETIRQNYIGKEGKFLVEITAKTNIFNNENYDPIKDAIKKATGRIPVGMPSIMNEVISLVEEDIIKTCIICFVIVILLLGLVFKSIKGTLITVIPVILTIYMTLGILPLIGKEINVFSIAAFPLIIGIGIDSGIHIMHRLRADSEKGLSYVISNTGKAVIMTSITTMIGFGSLGFINHPGMANLGITVALGMIICILLTLTFIPAAYRLFNPRSQSNKDRTYINSKDADI